MTTFWEIVGLIVLSFVLFLVMVLSIILVTGWLIHKAQANPGTPFFKAAKGEVFTIQDAGTQDDPFKDAEKNVLDRTSEFLNKLAGGGTEEGQ